MRDINELILNNEQEINEIIDFDEYPLSMSTEMYLTGMFIERANDLLTKEVDYTEEALSNIFRKVRTHFENSFNNLKYIMNKKDISEFSEMEKFTNENKHKLKIVFKDFNHMPMEGIDLFRFEKQKHSYIVSINKVTKMLKDIKIYDFINNIDIHLGNLANGDEILKISKNKINDNKFKSNTLINNFLKDMYSKKEKTTDTIRKGSYLFKDVPELEKCINECLKFKDTYKESVHVFDKVKNMETNVDLLFDRLDLSTTLSKGEVKRIYKSLDMKAISNALSLYGVCLELLLKIEHNVILSTKKLIGALPV